MKGRFIEPSSRLPSLEPVAVTTSVPLRVPARRRRGRPLFTVLAASAVAFLLHLLFLSPRLSDDEGGFAMVARLWFTGGHYLFGPQWVDRPPALILLFRGADALGPLGPRITACLLAAAFVAAAGWAGWAARGAATGRWAAWIGAALVSSALLGVVELDGELAAIPWVMTSAAAILQALHRARTDARASAYGAIAGAAATVAVLTKQNFVDGLVFGGVLLAASAARRSVPQRRLTMATVGALTGMAAMLLPTMLWAWTGAGLPALWYACYGFRGDAANVIADFSLRAPELRLEHLLRLAATSGLVLLALVVLVAHHRAIRKRTPLAWATAAALVVELVGIAGGENYWPHYLLAPVPMVTLAAAVAATSRHRSRAWTRAAVLVVALVTLVSTPATAVAFHRERGTAYLAGSVRSLRCQRLGTAWWCRTRMPTSSTHRASPRPTPTPGACRCAPSTPTSRY